MSTTAPTNGWSGPRTATVGVATGVFAAEYGFESRTVHARNVPPGKGKPIMFNPNCGPCQHARAAGYDGCRTHNSRQVRYVVPTVGVMGDRYDPPVGVDVTDGDAVLNVGGGFGVDVRTGELEFEVAPGVYTDFD